MLKIEFQFRRKSTMATDMILEFGIGEKCQNSFSLSRYRSHPLY